ncbi:MAG: sodium:proton antiporter [Parafilimonas sp.]
MNVFSIITVLIVIASLFSYINVRFLKLPNVIGLMIISLFISVAVLAIHFINEDLFLSAKALVQSVDFTAVVFNVMLSFLLFAGALHVDGTLLKTQSRSVAVFSLFSVIFSTFIIGTCLYFLMQWLKTPVEYLYCLLFGSIVSPTDPIAVLGILTKAKIPKNIEINIVGESLFNDGIAIVIFITLLEMIHFGIDKIHFSDVLILFMREALGGILFGFLLGFLLFWMLKTIDNYETEVMLTLAFVMGGYALANYLHTSGPLAMVVAGLVTGNYSKTSAMSHTSRLYLDKFWEIIDVLMNAVLFVLIGLHLIILQFETQYIYASLFLVPLILFSRYISIRVPALLGNRFLKTSRKTQILLFWGGLRGGLSIAMVLSLSNDLPVKDLFVFVTYVSVVFSIFVQGLTVGPLAKKMFPHKKNEVQETIH